MFRKILQSITWKKKRGKTGLNGYVNVFSIDYNIININNTLDIYKYLMKTT